MTRAEVGLSTDCATQAPRDFWRFKHLITGLGIARKKKNPNDVLMNLQSRKDKDKIWKVSRENSIAKMADFSPEAMELEDSGIAFLKCC